MNGFIATAVWMGVHVRHKYSSLVAGLNLEVSFLALVRGTRNKSNCYKMILN